MFINLITRLVVFIVGFDEKLIIRSGFRIGIQPGDTALLVYSVSGGEFEKSKVVKAVETLRSIFINAGINLRELVLEANSFGEDVARLVYVLNELKPERLVVSLGSGMRYLGLVSLYASLIYRELVKNVELVVHVAREDGLYDVALNLDTLKLSIGRSELRLLCFVKKSVERDVVVRDSCVKLGKTRSTIYTLLHRMVKRGLIVLRNNVVELTPLGEALYYVFCGVESE